MALFFPPYQALTVSRFKLDLHVPLNILGSKKSSMRSSIRIHLRSYNKLKRRELTLGYGGEYNHHCLSLQLSQQNNGDLIQRLANVKEFSFTWSGIHFLFCDIQFAISVRHVWQNCVSKQYKSHLAQSCRISRRIPKVTPLVTFRFGRQKGPPLSDG